jgi:flagellin-like hook-associated protein FlgL
MRQNLFSLNQTTKLMDTTQNRLATGLRVASAVDDPVSYFAARGHTQRASDLSFLKDAMGEAVQLVTAGQTGIDGVLDLIESAKSLAQSAQSADTTGEINNLQTQFNNILDQISFLADDSGYKGINLLAGTAESLAVNFDESGTSKITLTGFDAEANTGLSIGDGAGWSTAGGTNISASITDLDNARTELRTQSKTLANNLSTITTRQDFTQKMINTLEDGAANLTNADLNEEGANMLMLQTRQSLGTTALSLASQAAQSVLRLF